MISKSFTLLVAATLLAPTVHAVEVWSDSFSTTRASAPNPYSYPGGLAGDDYNVTSVTDVNYNTAGGFLNISDASTTGVTPTFSVSLNQFAPATYTGAQITLSYDLRVNSLTAATAASAPRMSILNGTTEVFTIGFSHAAFTGAVSTGGDALGFYFVNGAAGSTVSASNGIGVSTFNFGQYSSSTATNNDTDRGSGDQFFRIMIAMTNGLTAVTGSITDLSTNTSVAFPAGTALTTALTWGVSPTNDGFRVTTGLSGTSNYDLDNISVNVVPEPSSALLGGFGLLGLLARRRRR